MLHVLQKHFPGWLKGSGPELMISPFRGQAASVFCGFQSRTPFKMLQQILIRQSLKGLKKGLAKAIIGQLKGQ